MANGDNRYGDRRGGRRKGGGGRGDQSGAVGGREGGRGRGDQSGAVGGRDGGRGRGDQSGAVGGRDGGRGHRVSVDGDHSGAVGGHEGGGDHGVSIAGSYRNALVGRDGGGGHRGAVGGGHRGAVGGGRRGAVGGGHRGAVGGREGGRGHSGAVGGRVGGGGHSGAVGGRVGGGGHSGAVDGRVGGGGHSGAVGGRVGGGGHSGAVGGRVGGGGHSGAVGGRVGGGGHSGAVGGRVGGGDHGISIGGHEDGGGHSGSVGDREGGGRYSGSVGGREGSDSRSSSSSSSSSHRRRVPFQPKGKQQWVQKSNLSPSEGSSKHKQSLCQTQGQTSSGIQLSQSLSQTQGQTSSGIQLSQSLSQTQGQTDPEQKEANIKPMCRPDKGGSHTGREYRILANHFPVQIKLENEILHYHVDVKATTPPQNDQPQKISMYHLSMVRERLFSNPTLSSTVHDGKNNIFSRKQLDNLTFDIDVGEGRRNVSYLVTLKLVKFHDLRTLSDQLQGNVGSIPREILQCFDLVLKGNSKKECPAYGRFFCLVKNNNEWGLQKVEGFHQSLKPTAQGLSLCIDYCIEYVPQKINVLDFLRQFITGFVLTDLVRNRRGIEKLIGGLKVTVSHRNTKQIYTIAGLTTDLVKNITFLKSDPKNDNPPTQTRLLDYFHENYRTQILSENIPALNLGGNKTNYVPMELCVLVEGQRYPSERLQETATTAAREKERKINTIVRSRRGPCRGDIIQHFGMSVTTSMTNVTGRVIKSPPLKIVDPNGEIGAYVLDIDKYEWHLFDTSVAVGKTVERWGILEFTFTTGMIKRDEIIRDFRRKYASVGLVLKEPVWHEVSAFNTLSDCDRVRELLEKININVQNKCRQQRLQFLLCVMADKHQGYKYLKWIAETKVGIVTQCCLYKYIGTNWDQYNSNIFLKINAKMGGSNTELINGLQPHFEGEGHVMFIGADVNHPASRDISIPSIAAVVATVNWPAATRYVARIYAQSNRVEKISNFGKICNELVSCYNEQNKVLPEKIVIFRDGVSESQFNMVLKEELEDLKAVFRESNYFPTITLIVAQKRHQTRFFPMANQGLNTGNIFPGTVVDTKVVHPFEFDFYLCSHFGSLGTSKPTHYHVLCDEHNFTSDGLQKLIYDMCFTFARCTRPISLVPPVYYADLTAYRGRLYYEAMDRMQSPGPAASSSSSRITSSSISSIATRLNDEGCLKLHADLENMMLFV